LIDDFLIERCQKLHKKEFVVVTDFLTRFKMGKRIHLCEFEADDLGEALNCFFEREVSSSRIKHGNKQTLDTLISEEAMLLAKHLRKEKNEWTPRLPDLKLNLVVTI